MEVREWRSREVLLRVESGTDVFEDVEFCVFGVSVGDVRSICSFDDNTVWKLGDDGVVMVLNGGFWECELVFT